MDTQLFFPAIAEASQISEARRLTGQLARKLGFNETEVGRVAIVVTEAATNLVKHANEGRLLVRVLDGGAGIEILALDQGPGIANLGDCLRDGYSTTGSPGTGLGAVMRLSSLFDIYSLPGRGTALLAQLWAQRKQQAANRENESLYSLTQPLTSSAFPLEIGAVCLPKPGQEESGDNWAVAPQADRSLFLLADGLGHGPDAAVAAREAIRVFRENSTRSPAEIIEMAHAALRRTRGAAVAVVELTPHRTIKFSGIGNIAGMAFNGEQRHHFPSHNGIVGHQLSKTQEFVYPWNGDILLILYSDGLNTRWNLDTYPGLRERHASLIAGVLYRDFQRGYDDVTVLVAKQ
jgi:anti-sigma regulatory factor (Ser/Thr protein kinase)